MQRKEGFELDIKLSTWILEQVNSVLLNDYPYLSVIGDMSNIDTYAAEDGDGGGGGGCSYHSRHSECGQTCSQYSQCHDTSYDSCNDDTYRCDCTDRAYSDCDHEVTACHCSRSVTVYYNTVTVVEDPKSVIINEGESARFTYSISSGQNVSNKSHQWYYLKGSGGTPVKITGATNYYYDVVGNADNDGNYYYCIFSSSQGTMCSSKARLTVNMVKPYDVWVAVGQKCQVPFSTNGHVDSRLLCSSLQIADTSIATISESGIVIGLSIGVTSATMRLHNKIYPFTIHVVDSPLDALFQTTAEVLRDKNDTADLYTPSEFVAELARTVVDN